MDQGITQTPQNAYDTNKIGITKSDFHKLYWFSPLQMIEVINPAWAAVEGGGFISKDYQFTVEMRHYIILAGKTERFPGIIANVYLDAMARIIAQNEDRLGFIGDPNLKREYYDKLIVAVDNLAPEYDAGPAYLRNVTPASTVQPKDERPPWDPSLGERATDVAPNAPEPMPNIPPPRVPETQPAKPAKDETREFELEGSKYKMIISKAGKSMFYKNGNLTSEAEYAKAASML